MDGAAPLYCASAFMAREGGRATKRIGHLGGCGLGFEVDVLLNSQRVCPFCQVERLQGMTQIVCGSAALSKGTREMYLPSL